MKNKNAQFGAWKSIAFWVILCLLTDQVEAQEKLPVIYATSSKVDIRDGGIMQKSVWNLSPGIKPDIYYSLESENTRKVTFYTDIDSISFNVEHDKNYDFLVVLNQADTCYTRIAGGEPKKRAFRTTLTPEQTQEDFILLVEKLQSEHGDITRYKTKEELKEIANSLFDSLDHPMDQYEFYLSVSKLISSIQNGHTGSSLPPELISDYEEKEQMFPVQLWFTNEKTVVGCDSLSSLPMGTEVLSINGEKINEIKNKLFGYISSDGSIESKKYWILNYGGFPLLYDWVYGKENDFRVEYKDNEGNVLAITLKPDYLHNSQCLTFDQNFDKYLDLAYPKNSTAVLNIRSFHNKKLLQTEEDFKEFVFRSFRDIDNKGVNKLIVDLRYNAGGEDANGRLLYSYLTDMPFQFSGNSVSGQEWNYPSAYNFKGDVIFLINGLSFSTASNFAAIAKSYDRGTFVGQETGGAYYGESSGETFRLTLPNSGIRVSIPKDPSYNPVKEIAVKDRGIIPDFMIIPSIKNVVENDDVQLKFAIDLAEKQHN